MKFFTTQEIIKYLYQKKGITKNYSNGEDEKPLSA